MMANWFLNTVVVFAVPELMQLGRGGVFFAFAGVGAISIVVVDLYLPETSGRSLEETAGSGKPDSVLMRAFGRICGRSARQIPLGSAADNRTSDPFLMKDGQLQ